MQSCGIVLLPENICRDEVRAGTLVRLASDAPLPAMPLYIVLPTRRHMPARMRAFIDFLVSVEGSI